ITMSLGTSGTLFAYSDTPIRPASKLIANFCSANGGWLPLICTMNITSATSHIQKCLKQDLTLFNQALAKSEIGANGIVILPFFNGERVPDLPQAKASIHNLDSSNFTDENLCRAIVESATYTLRYGLDLFRQAGIQPRQIRLIGGGAKSHHWRQIVADVTNCEVITLKHQEAAALGAAIQAAWAERATQLSKAEADAALRSLCEQFVVLEEENTHFPQPENVRHYAKFYQDYLDVLNKMYAEA
ncbi:FGGY-family carbohydrate kinase, partial [Avibacterium paragallinarum]